ncbi:hypothetical protein C8Q80DRAFT_1120260 [Daedaleopsis nitida]|nr:hypothetical protein C8Q80DRAFT_1120260 [Daedaleopsis nitida]
MLRASHGMEKLWSVEKLEERGDVLVLEGLVPEEDIAEIGIAFGDLPLAEISALRSTASALLVNVVEDRDAYSNDITMSFTRPVVMSGKCGTRSSAAEVSCENRHTVKGPETLRERRMSYLRAMHAMSNQPEARPPLPVIPISVPGVTEWKIEAGVLGARRPPTSWKIPEFVVKYGGSPKAHLRAQRGALAAEVQRRRTDRLLGRVAQLVPVPVLAPRPSKCQAVATHERERLELDKQRQLEAHSVREEASRAKERERQEIEEYLRSADIDAADLDERNMRDVVDAVMMAAAEATRLDI